jgi:hypothetical protein
MYSARYYRDSVKYMVWVAAGDVKMAGTSSLWIQYCLLGQTWYFNLLVLELLISFIFLRVCTFLLLMRVSSGFSCLFCPSFLYVSLRSFNTTLSTVRHFRHHTCSSGSSEVRIILNGFHIASVTVSSPLTVHFSYVFNYYLTASPCNCSRGR